MVRQGAGYLNVYMRSWKSYGQGGVTGDGATAVNFGGGASSVAMAERRETTMCYSIFIE
jgi:hypothetical protein